MKRPDEVKLNREEGEALIERLENNTWTADDRHVLAQVLRMYFWLLFMLQESKLSLKRFRAMLFGDKPKRRKKTASGDASEAGSSNGNRGVAPAQTDESQAQGDAASDPKASDGRRRGHGRQGADAYRGAQHVECRHEELGEGDGCPACGFGRLYRLPPGVEIRIDGNALLSAIHYELEKFRCSACGAVFTANMPAAAGDEKYNARSRAALALSRYFLGVPFYRLEAYQALLGVPVADATQWDQVERLADSAYPVFEHLIHLAAQGELIYQDDTPVRILSLMKENAQAQVDAGGSGSTERSGMQSTALVVKVGEHTICLYMSGRAHAGENLQALLEKRQADRDKPLVMSDALSRNEAEETALIRCHCLAHGRRKFTEIEETFPAACEVVILALKQVFDHDEAARKTPMSAQDRLVYHQTYSGPIMTTLKTWMKKQFEEREVEPNSSLGKAFNYLLGHWETLTRFLHVPGAPLDNNTAERALKLLIRQRKNSLFYATDHSAYVASLLTSLMATCVQASVNAMDYLVALQEHRKAVCANPALWLPWNYHTTLAPL
jgi:transposase